MNKRTLNVKITVPDQTAMDIFTTAIEGGINYWALVNEYVWQDSDYYASIQDVEDEAEHGYIIDRAVVEKGLCIWSQQYPERWARFTHPDNDWDHDAEDADMIVQCGLFGKVVYG